MPSLRRRRRSGGSGRGFPNVGKLLLPSVAVGAGAVGVEFVMGSLPLPDAVKVGPVRHLTKAVIGIGLGMAIGKFGNRKAGEAFASGALVIASHDAIKEGVLRFMPAAKFAGVGEYVAMDPALGYGNSGEVFDGEFSGVGEYVDFDD